MNYPITRREITHVHPRQVQQPTAGPIQPISEQYAIVPLSMLQSQYSRQGEQDPAELPKRISLIAGGALAAVCFFLVMSAIQGRNDAPMPAATPAPTPQQPTIVVIPQQQQPAPERSRCIIFCAN